MHIESSAQALPPPAIDTASELLRAYSSSECAQRRECHLTESGAGAPLGDGRAGEASPLERLQDLARNIAAGNDRYREVVDAAVEIVRSDAASVQVFDDDRGGLRLVGWRGFDPASAEFWGLVVPESASTCGLALAGGDRVVVSDVEAAAALAGSEDLEEYRRSRLRAVQSTPLVADDGHVLGMLSTHWHQPHEVRGEELLAIDLLAQLARARRAKLLDWAEKSATARRQYGRGVLNRLVATKVEELEGGFHDGAGAGGTLTVLCACGRDGCHEVVALPFAAYEQVRVSPHRFVVAMGHAAEVDEVLVEGDGYAIVAVKPEYRDPVPPTAGT